MTNKTALLSTYGSTKFNGFETTGCANIEISTIKCKKKFFNEKEKYYAKN